MPSPMAKMELKGFDETIKKFQRLGKKSGYRAPLKQAANRAATPIVKAVRAIWKNEAYDSGLSSKSVDKKVYTTKSGAWAIIGIDKEAVGVSHGRKHVPSNVDHLVELGFQLADGTTVPAVAPLRRGYEEAKGEAEQIFANVSAKAVEKEALKRA